MCNNGFCFYIVFQNQIVYTEPTLYRCISMTYSKNQFQNKIIFFFCFFGIKTQILKVQDIKSISSFVKIMKLYEILFDVINCKVTKLTHGTITF